MEVNIVCLFNIFLEKIIVLLISIRHMKIPHAPKHMNLPKPYFQSDEYKHRQMKKKDNIYFDNHIKDSYKVQEDKDKENRKQKLD